MATTAAEAPKTAGRSATLELLRWHEPDGCLVPDESAEPHAIVIADSWLVRGGRARAASRHWDRFGGSVAPYGLGPAQLAGFRAAATALLPCEGAWFPRVELHRNAAGEVHLALRHRQAPPLVRTAALWTADGDPRRSPDRKGPDLDVLHDLRDEAVRHGADEAVLVGPDGSVREGALSSLVWWDDEGDDAVLGTAPLDGAVLPGVTRAIIIEHCERTGVRVRYERLRPEALARRECWILSALHGIRLVTGWDGRPAPAADPARLTAFRAKLRSAARRDESRPVRPRG
jgi:branched-subunit amino acid aminotransferase/4-amino-4-deoxychorismate lyase